MAPRTDRRSSTGTALGDGRTIPQAGSMTPARALSSAVRATARSASVPATT